MYWAGGLLVSVTVAILLNSQTRDRCQLKHERDDTIYQVRTTNACRYVA